MRSFKIKGDWWLPDISKRKIFGTLEYDSEDGATLFLEGTFVTSYPNEKYENLKLIYGKSNEGKYITLHKCFLTNFSIKSQGKPTSTFYANRVFIGGHFETEEDLIFQEVVFSISGLEDWLVENRFKNFNYSSDKVSLLYNKPEDINLYSSDDFSLSICFAYDAQQTSKSLTIEHKSDLKISFNKEVNLENILTKVFSTQQFFAFALLEKVILEFVSVFKTDAGEKHEIEIYFPALSTKQDTVNYRFDSVLFNYNSLNDKPQFYLSNWFKMANKLRSSLDQYFSLLYKSTLLDTQAFLAIIQAIEFFHRNIFNGEYVSAEEYRNNLYKNFISSIPPGTPRDFKESLKRKLLFSNEYSLRKRLKEIIKSKLAFLKDNINKTNEIIDSAVGTRNYLIHRNEEEKSNAKSGIALYNLTNKLKYILICSLLLELGFSEENIVEMLSRNQKMKFFLKDLE